MVLTALFMAMIMVLTAMTKIPVPATKGYVHLGDCMIFVAVVVLGRKYGTIAAGVGSALADIIGGYAYYAPVTLIVKSLMAFVMARFIIWALKKFEHHPVIPIGIGMALAGALMATGYYCAEVIMYGNFLLPVAAIPGNIAQFVAGMAVALPLTAALSKTPIGKSFAFPVRMPERMEKTPEVHHVNSKA